MPVKKEIEMHSDEVEAYILRRIPKRKCRHCESRGYHPVKRRQGRRSKQGIVKAQKPPKGLVKIELDAAEALAEFSRVARMPHQQNSRGNCLDGLKWSGKRRRTTQALGISGLKTKDESAPIIAEKSIPFCTPLVGHELDSMTNLSQDDKTSLSVDSRAESPCSPLPSAQLPSKTGGPNGKSAFQLETMRKSSLTPVKREIEQMELDSVAPRPPLTQKGRAFKTTMSDQSEGSPDSKGAVSQCLTAAESGEKVLENSALQLVEFSQEVRLEVVANHKDEEEKEARRLRRIQANRESARQAIRRKQILCEDLRVKAAVLAQENEGMKQRRELLMQELYFLKDQNHHLNMQLDVGFSGNFIPESCHECPRIHSQIVTGHLPHFSMAAMLSGAASLRCSTEKDEIEEEREVSNDQSMHLQMSALVVPGIHVSSLLVPVIRGAEQEFNHGVTATSVPLCKKEPSSDAGCCVETTLQMAGVSCDLDSAAIDAQRSSAKSACVNSCSKPATSEVVVHSGGSLCRPTAFLPFKAKHVDAYVMHGSNGHGTSRSKENIEHCRGPQIGLPVIFGSDRISMNASSSRRIFGGALAAAEARRRRKELLRRKFTHPRASKLVV